MRNEGKEPIDAGTPALVVTYGNANRKVRPLDGDLLMLGRNPVCDDDQGARTELCACRNIEFSGDWCTARRDGHCAVAVSASVEDVTSRIIGDSH